MSDLVLGLEVVGDNAISNWRMIAGPTNPAQAKTEAPKSIRAIFGTDSLRNAIHAARDGPNAKREAEIFFSPSMRPPA